jgi:hypothetical protein
MSTPMKTESPLGLDALDARNVMNYVECSLAADLTLPEWRRTRAATTPRRRHGLRHRISSHRHTPR